MGSTPTQYIIRRFAGNDDKERVEFKADALSVEEEANKPDDWDDEKYDEWEAPMKDNAAYKGDWSVKRVSNPAYLGVWEAKKIANPECEDDDAVYKYADFGFIGFDLSQVKGDTIIDNVIIQYQAKYEEASRVLLRELVKKLTPESISKEIEKQVQGIFPLKDTLIRKLKILKKPKFDIAKLMEMHGDGGDDEAGVAGGFLQTPIARILQQVVAKSDLPETDQEEVTAFLSQSSEYAPQCDDIIGIVKQMGDTLATTLGSIA